jgi:hypothetical protein
MQQTVKFREPRWHIMVALIAVGGLPGAPFKLRLGESETDTIPGRPTHRKRRVAGAAGTPDFTLNLRLTTCNVPPSTGALPLLSCAF